MSISRCIRISGIMLIIFLFGFVAPVLAGEKYSSGQPDISAAIEGSNELLIGEKTDITVLFSNSGLIDMKFVEEGAITPDYLPTTALSLSAQLLPGNSPAQVTADPQILGDVKAGDVVKATFPVTVPESATAGSYEIPVTISYQYMNQAIQTGTEDIEYSFRDEQKPVYLPVMVRPAVHLEIISVDTGDLNVGGEGHIIVNVKNDGSDTGKETVFTIQPVGNNPIVPFQDSIYIGDYPEENIATLSYKVSVATDADPAIKYPLKLFATYNDYQGLQAESNTVDVSAGFKQKVSFIVTSEPETLISGSKDEIAVDYQNAGSVPVYNAQAGINIVDPFTSEDDQSYLGTIQPGETVTARFKLNVNSGSTAKQYGLDSEIRYTDFNQTEFVSDPIKIPVIVTSSSSGDLVLPGIILILILLGGGYLYYKRIHRS